MPDLSDYAQMLNGKKCSKCLDGDLECQPIQYYDHAGGYQVEGFENRQWLWVRCPACNYQCALWKVGIPGKATSEEQEVEMVRHGLPLSPPMSEELRAFFFFR